MGYYTGTATTFANLATALKTACSTLVGVDPAAGWTLTGDILSKGSAFVKVFSLEARVNQPLEGGSGNNMFHGLGVHIAGGTGISGSNLIDYSVVRPRLGPQHDTKLQPVPPYNYEIYTFTNPDEVYMIVKWGGQYYYWLAFGVSDIPGVSPTGTGLWLSGSAGWMSYPPYSVNSYGISIGPRSGGNAFVSPYASPATSSAPFWDTSLYFYATEYTGGALNSTIHLNLEGRTWFGYHGSGADTTYINYLGAANASAYAYPLIDRNVQPNGEAFLVPIKVFASLSSNTAALAAELRNSRYMRLDNYVPEDIITLGSDYWKVYPFFRKNASARDGGTYSAATDHTGTFGWAIRHPGP